MFAFILLPDEHPISMNFTRACIHLDVSETLESPTNATVGSTLRDCFVPYSKTMSLQEAKSPQLNQPNSSPFQPACFIHEASQETIARIHEARHLSLQQLRKVLAMPCEHPAADNPKMHGVEPILRENLEVGGPGYLLVNCFASVFQEAVVISTESRLFIIEEATNP